MHSSAGADLFSCDADPSKFRLFSPAAANCWKAGTLLILFCGFALLIVNVVAGFHRDQPPSSLEPARVPRYLPRNLLGPTLLGFIHVGALSVLHEVLTVPPSPCLGDCLSGWRVARRSPARNRSREESRFALA